MNWREAHEEAMFVAAEAHEDLGVDTSREIDVFAAIESLDLELLFRPLAGAAGLYVSPVADRPGGVLINSKHRRARQRYTGGHELGHHLMGHAPSLEPEERGTRFLSEQLPREEMLAEAFAAWFLMPPELVDKVLEDLCLQRPSSPADVYALALRLGTSFEATALHTANLKLAQPSEAREWASTPLKTLKRKLCADLPPASYRGDVWALGVRHDKMALSLAAGDRLVVVLPDSPAHFGAATLTASADVGDSETPNSTSIFEDRDVDGTASRRVVIDFGEDADGDFRLTVPPDAEPLPGFSGEAFGLELKVRSPALGRRRATVTDTENGVVGTVSSIAGQDQ